MNERSELSRAVAYHSTTVRSTVYQAEGRLQESERSKLSSKQRAALRKMPDHPNLLLTKLAVKTTRKILFRQPGQVHPVELLDGVAQLFKGPANDPITTDMNLDGDR